ncbi:MAG: regulatory iron-sulfur-containing complex subunit RicT [Candidatus Aminicenantes bacterium]
MSDLICVQSETTGRLVRARSGEEPLVKGDRCIVESEFGGDLAVVLDGQSVLCRNPKAARAAVQVLRKATEEDVRKFDWLREREGKAFELCLRRIQERNLPMKLVAVRYFFNEKKGIFYYTADGRIDFRQLVKDLAKDLRMRIEMRQVGVRDEAKMIGGLGVCGRCLCCSSFMKTFEPVTIQKARKQQIVINPTKISGLCGRLMCCLAFEEETRGRMFHQDDRLIED